MIIKMLMCTHLNVLDIFPLTVNLENNKKTTQDSVENIKSNSDSLNNPTLLQGL